MRYSKIYFTLLLAAFFLCCNAYGVSVLHVSTSNSHSPTKAAVGGDIVATYVTGLSGVNFSAYDVIYVDEHSTAAMFSGYESAIRSAMNSGYVGFVAEYCPVEIMNNIFGMSLVSATAGSALTVTSAGSTHPIITGSGLSNGAAMTNAANLDGSKRSFTSASVSASYTRIITDNNSNVYAFGGAYGLGRFFILGNEAMESTPNQNEKNLIHNAIMYTMAPDASASLSASNTNFGNVRVGTSANATVTVTNTGTAGSTLTGTIGAAAGSEFSPVSGTQSFTLGQNQNAQRTYTYTPNARGADSTTISVNSSAGNTTRTLSGTGVSPVFNSSVAVGSTVDFGEVGYIANQSIAIQNLTTDTDLGNLTNMSLMAASITGPDASYFSLENFTPGMVLTKNQLENLLVSFMHNYGGRDDYGVVRTATLTITTDVGTAFGSMGSTYSFNLQATTIPEPSTILMFGIIAIAGLWLNKKTA